MIVRNHHPAYIGHEEWDETQQILTLNAPSKKRSHLGSGRGLMQGIVRCGIHGLSMSVRYGKPTQSGEGTHSYQCDGDHAVGGRQCVLACGRTLDRVAGQAIIDKLMSPSLAAVRAAWEQAAAAEDSGERFREAELDRARRSVEQAKKRYLAVDPENRTVAAACEVIWEEEARKLKELESKDRAEERSGRTVFTAQGWDELLALCNDVSAIWHAPTTTIRDQKEIARTLIEQMVVDLQTPEIIRAHIVWTDETSETVIEAKRSPYARRLIREWAADGLHVSEIVQRLNAAGLRTRQGRPWSKAAVQLCIQSQAMENESSSA